MMLGFFAAVLWYGARIPTYAYFNIPDEFTEVDIKEPIVEECYQFGVNISRQFLVEFSGPHPIVLLHAWKKTSGNGDFYGCEVMRLRERYLIKVHIPNPEEPEKKYFWSARALNEEIPSGAHWFNPPDDILDLAMDAVRKEYPDAELSNVAVFKTIMKVNMYAQMVLDVKKDSERMLLDISLERAFGSKEQHVKEIRRIY
jgi:hypothetical protein